MPNLSSLAHFTLLIATTVDGHLDATPGLEDLEGRSGHSLDVKPWLSADYSGLVEMIRECCSSVPVDSVNISVPLITSGNGYTC